jgi:hypothetical protein
MVELGIFPVDFRFSRCARHDFRLLMPKGSLCLSRESCKFRGYMYGACWPDDLGQILKFVGRLPLVAEAQGHGLAV